MTEGPWTLKLTTFSIALASSALTVNHLMCSQSSNLQDITACSNHSPSCMGGPDSEPDSSSRQEYNTPSLTSDMVRYMMPTEDVRYTQESGNSHSPVFSSEPAGHSTFLSSTLSSAPYSLQSPLYQHTHNLSSSAYHSAGNYSYPPNPYSMSGLDIKPRLGSINSAGLGSLTRSAALPHPTYSPLTTRDQYTGSTPSLLRRNTSEYLSRSPSASGLNRGVTLSPSTSGFTSPISNMDSSIGGSTPCPPLGNTEIHCALVNSNHEIIKPEIFGRIDKGFFQADGDWTCYRRNYFSLSCSYTLHPTQNGSMYLQQSNGGQGPQVHGFSMSIAAVVDGRGGKSIDLVQHTPKRDKGPQDKPARINLSPRPPTPMGLYGDSMGTGRTSLYDNQTFAQNPNQPAQEAMFERIQFKNATANNGKRRAAQQYYHILVELFADVGSHAPTTERWVKIASRMSAKMVVRGRSPGHYQSDRRGSNSSNSGPGSGGAGGAGGYTPSGSVARTPGDITMSGTSSMMGGSAYGHNSYDTRGGLYRSHQMVDSVAGDEDDKMVATHGDYLYYPNAPFNGEHKHTISRMGDFMTSKLKHENNIGGGGQFDLPRLTAYDGFGRPCRPYEGVNDPKAYFGMMHHHEASIPLESTMRHHESIA